RFAGGAGRVDLQRRRGKIYAGGQTVGVRACRNRAARLRGRQQDEGSGTRGNRSRRIERPERGHRENQGGAAEKGSSRIKFCERPQAFLCRADSICSQSESESAS